MSGAVRHPKLRREVMDVLARLADAEYQRRTWTTEGGSIDGDDSSLDDVIHSLYDDTLVLPRPADSIGSILVAGDEIVRLAELSSLLDRLIDEHGDSDQSIYLDDSRWNLVVAAASSALAAMVRAWAL